MATIIEASLPVEDFALVETLQDCPEATVECEQIVEHPDETVMPLVWVRHTAPDAFETALEQDPTVATYTRLAATATEHLYEMDWTANVQFMLRILTIEGAVILDTVGTGDGWHLRVLFPDREDVRTTTDFCETHHLDFTIERIHHLEEDDVHQGSIRAGLTAPQREALTAAYQQGYFNVPRAVDLEAVATDLGISHQALSERLRRGHATLIEETLVNVTATATTSAGHTDEERARSDVD